MDKLTQEELKAYLMQSNEEFRKLAEEHAEYARQIDAIEAKPHLTNQDEAEEHRLKKLKLHAKDLMLQIMSRHRAEQVA
jgi:uncharacterized protein YdcH (DUF465 family)